MTVARPRTSSKARSKVRKTSSPSLSEVVSSLSGMSLFEPLSVSESKRPRITKDIKSRGYHVLVGKRGPRALVVERNDTLLDHLTGRPIEFRRTHGDHYASDDETTRRAVTRAAPISVDV
mmetsp:Transcript_35592/g.113803  ORF Transcript_35592/g.113803 Transcript_35592/m.113803 type:complete len:120 (-) Transcript_35592:1869-2228(-)